MTRTLCAFSSGSPPLIRMPFVAPTPVPTITAVGVAKPSAQGHAMHRTVVANWNACSNTDSDTVRPRFYNNEVCMQCSYNGLDKLAVNSQQCYTVLLNEYGPVCNLSSYT